MTETIRVTASRLVIQAESFIRAYNLQPVIDRALNGPGRDGMSDEELMHRRSEILYGFMLSTICGYALRTRIGSLDNSYVSDELFALSRELPPGFPVPASPGDNGLSERSGG